MKRDQHSVWPGRRWQIGLGIAALLLLAGAGAWRVHARSERAALLRADPDALLVDARRAPSVLKHGRAVFAAACAECHGAAGAGDTGWGVPDLRDPDHLYGSGSAAEIEQIVRYGIRSRNSHGWNLASMPVYASRRPSAVEKGVVPLGPREIGDLVQFLLAFTGRSTDAAAARRGRVLYAGKGGCYDCHSSDGGGDPSIGAPTLTDDIWLYGGSPAAIRRSIELGRAGVSPAFAGKLDAAEIRAVAIYAASLAVQENKDGR